MRSVLDQAGVAVELLVMDGGSTDGTHDELTRLADGGSTDGTHDELTRLADGSGSRLRWQCQADSGLAEAVNRAVAVARAPLIGWLNSDDLYEPGALARVLHHLAAHPQQMMVYGQTMHVDERGQFLSCFLSAPIQV